MPHHGWRKKWCHSCCLSLVVYLADPGTINPNDIDKTLHPRWSLEIKNDRELLSTDTLGDSLQLITNWNLTSLSNLRTKVGRQSKIPRQNSNCANEIYLPFDQKRNKISS